MRTALRVRGKTQFRRFKVLGRFLHRALPLDVEAWSFVDGLRAATACALPVMIAELTGVRGFSWIAIVAFWGCLADTGGTWHLRFVSLTVFTVFATLGCLLALFAGHFFIWAVILAILWSFVFSFGRLYGGAASTVGNLLTLSVLVSLSMPSPSMNDTLIRTGLTLIGALWAMLLVLVIWRIYPHRPARKAAGQVWHAVAQMAEFMARADETENETAWIDGVRTMRARIRDTMETARSVIASRRKREAGRSMRNELILVMLADADETFAALIALSELLDPQWDEAPTRISPRVTRSLRLAMHRTARQADAIAAALHERTQQSPRHPGQAIERFRRQLIAAGAAPGAHYAAELLARIAEYLSVAGSTLAGLRAPRDLSQAIADKPAEPLVDLASAWGTLRANLSWQSLTFRHALRVAATAGVGEAIISGFEIRRGYWLVLTGVVVLQPYLSATWRRALERAGGSVLGGFVAAVIGLVAKSPLEITAAIFPLSIIAMAFRQVNYAIFTFWLTPQFVLIAELFQTGGTGGTGLAGLRALYSFGGGVIGLMAAMLLWPSHELPGLPMQLASMIRLHGAFLKTVLGQILRSDSDRSRNSAPASEARRKMGLASNNVEATLQRLLSEPHWRTPPEAEPVMTIITCARRLAGAATALSLAARISPTLYDEIENFARWADASIAISADALEAGKSPLKLPPPPELAQGKSFVGNELARIRRQAEVLHGAVERLVRKEVTGLENEYGGGRDPHHERVAAVRP